MNTHDQGGDLLRSIRLQEEHARRRQRRALPDSIGGFKIVAMLGRGGMGVVYRAEQAEPQRHVALKVMRHDDTASGDDERRFLNEAAYLGRLTHPGIARVYASGIDEDGRGGRPWIAMELVEDARSITEWVHETDASIDARLDMLISVCDAVHHAHQNGIIHRDLKPDNILVTADAAPKVLDFGVARPLDADVRAVSLMTERGQLLGTPWYMSPEQTLGDPAEIDTSTDVYALGVIAFRLLAGRLPYAERETMPGEAFRIIREEEPTRLGSVDRLYRGDVETVVGKALEKDKTRRYRSAAEFADDLRRVRQHEAILAHAPSRVYRMRKFVRRNRLVVTALTLVFVALIVGTATTSVQAARAQREAARAQSDAAALDAFTRLVFDGLDRMLPDASEKNEVSAFLHIVDGLSDQLDTIESFPESHWHAAMKLAGYYSTFNELDRAIECHRTAIDSLTRTGDPVRLLYPLRRLARDQLRASYFADALETAQRADEIVEGVESLQRDEVEQVRYLEMNAIAGLGDLDGAMQMNDDLLRVYAAPEDVMHPLRLETLHSRIAFFRAMSEPRGAVDVARELLEMRRQHDGPEKWITYAAEALLASTLRDAGQYAVAMDHYLNVRKGARAKFNENGDINRSVQWAIAANGRALIDHAVDQLHPVPSAP